MTRTFAGQISERLFRGLAARTSRRSLLSRIGLALVAAPVFPLLPVSRAFAAKPDPNVQGATDFATHAQAHDATRCDYWRYCAIDGSLCSCCGGSVRSCPPGTEASPTSWVGSCVNPEDKKAYLIAYRDCCGVAECGQCECDNTDRETPSYRPQTNNEIIWCFGVSGMEYHCSTAVLVGAVQ